VLVRFAYPASAHAFAAIPEKDARTLQNNPRFFDREARGVPYAASTSTTLGLDGHLMPETIGGQRKTPSLAPIETIINRVFFENELR
jgi:hypothetical protein